MNRSRRLIASILTCLMLVTVFLGVENTKRAGSAGAAINTWEQTDWSGGADGGTGAVHPTDQIGWNKYLSISNVSDTDSLGNAVLSTGNFTITDDGALTTTGSASGGGFANGTTSSTTVSGAGASASVKLTGTSTVVNTIETQMPYITGSFGNGSTMIRNGLDNEIYILQGNGTTSFSSYSVSSNTLTTLTAVPGAVSSGAQMFRNGSENDIYVFRGNNTTGFYKYSISGNSWTTLTAPPIGIYFGSAVIRNGSDNDIYVLSGNTTGFYKYSISGNSWSTLMVAPGIIGGGSAMIRNAADNDIYVMQGRGTTGFFKYSISDNSWTALTVIPGAVNYGGQMTRNGSDDDIYVIRSDATTSFYKYSIVGNSWTLLTDVPSAVNSGSAISRNGGDDDIYLLPATSNAKFFYKYSISGNSWTTLAPTVTVMAGTTTMIRNLGGDDIFMITAGTNLHKYSISGNTWMSTGNSGLSAVPASVGTGASMIRNGSDNDVYVLPGNSSTGFYKYSISDNSWTTLAAVPAAIVTGSSMIRNGADNDIYVVRGSSTSFYKYSISGNSWTTLTNTPYPIGSNNNSRVIRNGSEDALYVLASDSTVFLKYSISGNSWTTLTPVPGVVGLGNSIIRNGADDDIYVIRGSNSTGFYKYSISGNSWTTLTVVPAAISNGNVNLLRNGSDNDIYVMGSGSAFYKYSISGNSWTTLTAKLFNTGTGTAMLRNGSDNDIYVLEGAPANSASHLYKYSISGNTWSTLFTLPNPFGLGGVILRNGSDSQIYILQGNSSTNLWRYTIDSVSYPASGTFTSAVIDTVGVASLGNLSWTSTLPASTTLTFATRTGATAMPDGTWSAWSSELSTSAGSAIASPVARYIQYRGSFATSDTAATPSLADISVAYSAYQSSGDLVSSAYNSIDLDNVISGLSWTEDGSLPVGASVTVSLRSAATSGGLVGTWTDFTNVTPDCGKSGDTVTCTAAAIPASLKSGGDDQYVQYKLALATTDAAVTPTVGSVVTTYGVQAGSRNPGQGVITVVKTVINDNGGTKDFDDFPLFVNDLLVISGVSNTFPVTGGLFTVTETADANYVRTFSGSCDSDGNMNLGSGDNKLCIVTNDDISGGLVTDDPSVPPLIDVVKVPSPLSLPTAPGLVTYTYTVSNVGTVSMTEVSMLDDSCSPINRISGDTNANSILEVTETWIYSCSRMVSQTHTNTVVATGWANGLSATDIASATVVVGTSVTPPLIHVTKVPNPLALPIGGGLVTYTEQVSNPGIVALTNVTLTDDKCGPMKYISGDSNDDSRLDPTETWTYTCTTNLTQTTTNTATASGTANGLTVRDYAIVTVVVAPSAAALSYDVGLALSSSPTINIEKSLLAPSPDPAVHCVSGALIKAATDDNAGTQVDSTVYACGLDGKRYAFPDERTYYSWYPDFSGVQIISASSLAAIPRGGNVTYRPGSRLLKVASNSKVYAVAKGGVLRWVTSEAVAQALYGVNWNTKIDDIPLALFDLSYSVGLPINLADVGPTIAECTTTTTFTKTLTQGSTDAQVRPLQSLLQCLGHFPAGTAPTGYFGPVTQSAVKAFQSANGLDPVGDVGPATRDGLNRHTTSP